MPIDIDPWRNRDEQLAREFLQHADVRIAGAETDRRTECDHLADELSAVLCQQPSEEPAGAPTHDVDRRAVPMGEFLDQPVESAGDVVGNSDVEAESPTERAMTERAEECPQRCSRDVAGDEAGEHEHGPCTSGWSGQCGDGRSGHGDEQFGNGQGFGPDRSWTRGIGDIRRFRGIINCAHHHVRPVPLLE